MTTFSPMANPTPPNVVIQTLSPHLGNSTQYLLRLHHLYAVGEDQLYSTPVSIDLDGLFANKRIVSVTEMSLTANQKRSDVDRLQWITDSDVKQTYKWPKSNNPRRDTITIYPMEYRTYLLTFLESK
eukprot:TRINITY_DN2194_c0_g2_i2.p1 TRINITY_DN2194_c0_g2~~TRINITY_DN2194_c0_g2_i2.p1  ORF type:complete len:147 (-),score=24.18 TRINITY_DN2194_c0_g2_i2:61-441(-)